MLELRFNSTSVALYDWFAGDWIVIDIGWTAAGTNDVVLTVKFTEVEMFEVELNAKTAREYDPFESVKLIGAG